MHCDQITEFGAVLAHISADLSLRVALLDEKCHELRGFLNMLIESHHENTRKTKEIHQEKMEHEEITQAESALQEALKRARAIRQAQEKTKQNKAETLKPKAAPLQTEKAEAKCDEGESTKEERGRRLQLPRSMTSKLGDIMDTRAIWESKNAPPCLFQAKLNEIHSKRHDTSAPSIGISYQEQIFRLQHAFACISRILNEKCSTFDPNLPPSIARVFPLWYRLHKIKKLLEELNQELSRLMQRVPPPPQLSQETIHRSHSFLHAIQRKAPISKYTNQFLMDIQDKQDMELREDLYKRLQSAWESKCYDELVRQVTLEEVSTLLLPALRSSFGSWDSIDSLRLIRLVHSLVCCDGMMLRSFLDAS